MITDLDVVALGGNAIIPAGKTGTMQEQLAITQSAMNEITALLEHNRQVIITHGNGPIVGNIVVRNEAAKDTIPPMPLDVCGADSQGGIGYMIQQSLRNALHRRGLRREVVSIITQVRVDVHDPAFDNPVKPIGPYYTRDQADRLQRERGWITVGDSNRGYRRVVASPRPVEIIESEVIRRLVASGTIVIAAGGGGIPVVCLQGQCQGREAVIDKDATSALLAVDLGADRLIILTDVRAVYRDYGTPQATAITKISLGDVRTLIDEGFFPPGSMGSKLAAAVDFLEGGGKSVIICRSDEMMAAVNGESGTTVTP
ncbi:MAG: carbamate kinase [Candidatus Krumholzibacteria bacterium]|nr:carbamate kinase [Candidatus Krumholzibacteria bacterium]